MKIDLFAAMWVKIKKMITYYHFKKNISILNSKSNKHFSVNNPQLLLRLYLLFSC